MNEKMTNDGETIKEDDNFIYQTTKSKLTLNKYGKMSLTENPHFKLSRNMMNKTRPILEIGCAFGYTTRLLLNDGYQVIANDLDQRHLDILYESIESDEERKRLVLKPGDLTSLNFDENSLDGIIGLNVLHFLNGEQIREFFHKSFKWLAPGGLMVVSTNSPYFLIYKENKQAGQEKLGNFYKELRNKNEWPGYLEREKFFENNDQREKVWLRNGPNKMNLISAEILVRESVLAGFNIFKVNHFHENEFGYVESESTNQIRVASIICIKENIY
jgi:SAM-dependent methyltransferase